MSLQLNSLIMSDKQAGMEVIMAESIIKVENLVKSFGDHEVLKKIDFEISKGEVVCIIGSSGSGNQHCYVVLTTLKHLQAAKYYFMGKRLRIHKVHFPNTGHRLEWCSSHLTCLII